MKIDKSLLFKLIIDSFISATTGFGMFMLYVLCGNNVFFAIFMGMATSALVMLKIFVTK